jgi:hypothetical protein
LLHASREGVDMGIATVEEAAALEEKWFTI